MTAALLRDRFSTDEGDSERIGERCRQLLLDQWRVVDDALNGRDWLVGDSCTAADIYLQMISSFDENPQGFAARCPNVARASAAVEKRPAVVQAASRHAMSAP